MSTTLPWLGSRVRIPSPAPNLQVSSDTCKLLSLPAKNVEASCHFGVTARATTWLLSANEEIVGRCKSGAVDLARNPAPSYLDKMQRNGRELSNDRWIWVMPLAPIQRLAKLLWEIWSADIFQRSCVIRGARNTKKLSSKRSFDIPSAR